MDAASSELGGLPLDPAKIEEKVTETVHMMLEAAIKLGSSLSALEKNTAPSFWWTTWALGIVVGLFVLGMLVKVRSQLAQLNRYQAVFQRMWTEDRENEERRRRQKEREQWEKERERGKGKMPMRDWRMGDVRDTGQGYNTQAQPQPQYGGFMDDIIDAVGPIPQIGSPEYEEFLDDLRDVMHGE